MNNTAISILAILIALVMFFAYTKPTYDVSIAEQRAAIAADKSALLAAADYRERSNELLLEREAMDPEALGRLENMLPDSVNNVRAILELNALATRAGVGLSAIDVARASKDSATSEIAAAQGPVASVRLSLSARGTYSAFRNFLHDIEMSERFIDVSEVSVTSSETGVYGYKMSAQLYWLR